MKYYQFDFEVTNNMYTIVWSSFIGRTFLFVKGEILLATCTQGAIIKGKH